MTKNNIVLISKNGLLGQVRTTTFYTNNKKFVEVKFKFAADLHLSFPIVSQ